jgi:hypothetical protein
MPVIKLETKNGKPSSTVDVVKCSRHTIRPSAIESVSDVFTPFTPGAKSKVIIYTIGGQTHEQEFADAEMAEDYRLEVMELAFG